MLHAILHGKARRVSVENQTSIRWKTLFNQYEDLLTAAFWGRVAYFSPDILNRFISLLLHAKEPPGEFETLTFWPTFDLNGANVEPDVLIEFEKLDILIEVKPPTGGGQYYDQWQREIDSYKQSNKDKKLIFLALGNNHRDQKTWRESLQTEKTRIISAEWKDVRDCLLALMAFADNKDKRIINDCLSALSLYGIKSALPLWSDLKQLIELKPLPSLPSLLTDFSNRTDEAAINSFTNESIDTQWDTLNLMLESCRLISPAYFKESKNES